MLISFSFMRLTTDCADHLLSLVNDILDFERIESNQLELEQIPFSIVCETRKVVNMVRFPAGTPPPLSRFSPMPPWISPQPPTLQCREEAADTQDQHLGHSRAAHRRSSQVQLLRLDAKLCSRAMLTHAAVEPIGSDRSSSTSSPTRSSSRPSMARCWWASPTIRHRARSSTSP
jgi:hypothetical protein